MAAEFDPYYKWLGIPQTEQPPNHYRLLGLGLFEASADVIETAADRQMRHVQTFKTGQHSADSQRLLNELSQARLCLLRPEMKAAYDRQLQATLHAQAVPPAAVAAQPIRKAIALEEPHEVQAIIPNTFSTPSEAGTAPPIGRSSRRSPPWLLPVGGLIAACLVAAVAFVVWRLQPIAPELAPLADQTIDEGQPLELTPRVTNPKAAAQTLEYFLVEGAPPGSRVDRSTGKFTWTPSEEQGPGQYQATVRAAVAGSPSVFHQQTVRISVNEVARPAQLDEVEARHLTQRNGVLSLQLRARDVDLPATALRYSVSMEPAVASSPEVDERGLFSWQPASADLGKQYQITFKVSKGSDESLSAQQAMSVSLKAPASARPPVPTVASTPPTPAPMPSAVTPTPDPAPPATASPALPEATATAKKKAEVPEADAQKKAAEKIEMIFREQFSSRKPEDRRSLARDLLRQAPGTSELAERYVLLLKARGLAVAVNDVPTAWEAIEAADQDFQIEALEQKVDALKKGTGVTRTPAEARDHVERSIALMEQALREEKFDLASPLVQPATASAAKLKEPPLVNRVKDLSKDLKDQKKEYEAVQTARETLKESPDDPEANFAVGRYLCLSRDEWSEGLPLLIKSNNEKWAAAAKADRANPTTPAEQVAAGDAWWALAESGKTAEKEALQQRAGHWYRQAAPHLTGLDKLKLDKKLEKLPAPAASASLPLPLPIVPPAGASRTPPAPLPVAQPADLKTERRVAEAHLKSRVGDVSLKVEGQQQTVRVTPDMELPQANFIVYSISMTNGGVTDENLANLKDLKYIDRFTLYNNSQVSDSSLAHIHGLSSLRYVSIHQAPISDRTLAGFGRLTRLENLNLHGNFTGSGLSSLTGLTQLTALDLQSNQMTDEVFSAVARMPRLERLDLSSPLLRGNGLTALRSLPLRNLDLDGANIEESQMSFLAGMTSLTNLTLKGNFGDATLAHVARLPSLRYLHWEGTSFTAAGMRSLTACRTLEQITLGPLTDETLKSVAAVSQLRSINITNAAQLTDKGLAPLANLTALTNVMVQNASAAITNDGLAHLAKLPAGQSVYVSGATGINDAGLQHFKGRFQFRSLSFYGSQVTDAGIAALKQALPNCQVSK